MYKARQYNQFHDIDEIPAKYEERNCTDFICVIIAGVLCIGLAITSFFSYNHSNYLKSNFPTDSQGTLCGIDEKAIKYPYIYFADLPRFQKRICVAQCPKKGDLKVDCIKTENIGCRFSEKQNFKLSYYENYADINENGNFCMPQDENIRYQLISDSQLILRGLIIKSLNIILLCMLIALVVSATVLIMVQFFPYFTISLCIMVGWIMMVVLCLCIGLYQTFYVKVKWTILGLFIIFTILVGATIWKNRQGLKIFCLLIKKANSLVRDRPRIIWYIPAFIILTSIYMMIFIYEFMALWTGGKLKFNPQESLYYEIQKLGPSFGTFFWLVQVIWGLTFLKESYNFCISGIAIQRHYQQSFNYIQPFDLLIFKHLGSVLAGSFMTAFFTLPDLLFDLIYPYQQQKSQKSCYTSIMTKLCSNCSYLFQLTRSDALGYVYLCGTPFCNSSRYCEYLCQNSLIVKQSQSTSRSYRICAHLLIAGIVSLFGLYVRGSISLTIVTVIFTLSIFISTFFISFHADAAQAIQIITRKDQQFCKRKNQLMNNLQFRRQDFNNFQLNKDKQLERQIIKIKLEQKRQVQNGHNQNCQVVNYLAKKGQCLNQGQ